MFSIMFTGSRQGLLNHLCLGFDLILDSTPDIYYAL
jgi:hypothetical protein